MSDARWIEIDEDVASCVRHLGRGVEIFAQGGLAGEDLASYKNRMAFMQAMQAGHTSLESAIERILDLMGEEKPQGGSYHADLVRRARRAVAGSRPPILGPALADAIDETRRFRHVARRTYDDFAVERAAPAVAAARLVHDEIAGAIATFRNAIEP